MHDYPAVTDMKPSLKGLASMKWAFESLNNLVQVAAIIAAGVWACYTFVYQDKIKPLAGSPSIIINNSLAKIGQQGDLLAVRLTSTVRNTGTMGIRFLAYYTEVFGYRIDRTKQPGASYRMPLQQIEKTGQLAENKYFERKDQEFIDGVVRLLEGSTSKPSGSVYLEPGGNFTFTWIVYVDRRQFDEINGFTRYFFTKNLTDTFPMVARQSPKGFVYIEQTSPSECTLATSESFDCVFRSDLGTQLSLW